MKFCFPFSMSKFYEMSLFSVSQKLMAFTYILHEMCKTEILILQVIKSHTHIPTNSYVAGFEIRISEPGTILT